MKTWLFFSKFTDISRRGVLKELEVCDFDKTWSHVNETVAVAVENVLNFFIIRQSVNMATNVIIYCGLAPVNKLLPRGVYGGFNSMLCRSLAVASRAGSNYVIVIAIVIDYNKML